MKYKNATLMNSNFMETITKCNDYEDFSPKESFQFNRFFKKLADAYHDFEDVRIKIVKKFGTEDEDGDGFIVPKEKSEDFQKEMNELLNEEFEIEGFNKLKFPMELKLSPKEMGQMEDVFDMSELEDDSNDKKDPI